MYVSRYPLSCIMYLGLLFMKWKVLSCDLSSAVFFSSSADGDHILVQSPVQNTEQHDQFPTLIMEHVVKDHLLAFPLSSAWIISLYPFLLPSIYFTATHHLLLSPSPLTHHPPLPSCSLQEIIHSLPQPLECVSDALSYSSMKTVVIHRVRE